MNETIGIKGGKNDRRKRILITKQQKKELMLYYEKLKKDELKKLEQKVRREQCITFIKTIPIVLAGQVYKTLAHDSKDNKKIINSTTQKEEIDKTNYLSPSDIKEKEQIINDEIEPIDDNKKENDTEFIEENKKQEPVIITSNETTPIEEKIEILQLNTVDENELKEQKIISKEPEENNKQVEVIVEKQDVIPIKQTPIGISNEEKFDRVKNHKIVDQYEKRLKEIRTDLRKLIFEYNVLVDEAEVLYDSKEAEKLLDKLNEIIEKIEQLKRKIELPNMDKYDDNYLYTLIEDCMKDFNNKKIVDDIKDSSLYISISEKLDELDSKKDTLSQKIEGRKEKLEVDENKLEEIKEKYFDYEKFNTDLLKFQSEQDFLMQQMNEKIANATTITEKVEVQVTSMTKQSKRLLQLLALQMMLPGARSAKGLATATATYLYFMKNILKPKTRTKRYKVIKVEDYKKEIENSLFKLDDISNLLKRTSAQLDTIIKNFINDYQEYFAVLPECAELLANLEKIQSELKEKEYELERIKQEQQRNIEKNEAKVKHLENY